MNIVFKLRTVEELGSLHKALEETMTLQKKFELEQEIKKLEKTRREVRAEIRKLREEADKLLPEDQKRTLKSNPEDDECEEEVELPRPSSSGNERTNANDERFIVEGIDEAMEGREESENVEGNSEIEAPG